VYRLEFESLSASFEKGVSRPVLLARLFAGGAESPSGSALRFLERGENCGGEWFRLGELTDDERFGEVTNLERYRKGEAKTDGAIVADRFEAMYVELSLR
jgi:hypothetical protein